MNNTAKQDEEKYADNNSSRISPRMEVNHLG